MTTGPGTGRVALAEQEAPAVAVASEGRHDHAMRRAAQRNGRERGCWVYIPAVQLLRTGFGTTEAPPFYRVWGSSRGRVVVQLYGEQ